MKVTAFTDYHQQIKAKQKELDEAFTLLKHIKRLDKKVGVSRLQKRINHLVEELTDLKYRAASQ